MYCRNCGEKIDNTNCFCANCGWDPKLGNSFCCKCGARTLPHQVTCLNCGQNLSSQMIESDRNVYIAAILAFLLGAFGIHDFYLGYTSRGVIKIVLTLLVATSFISGIWSIVDLVLILTGKMGDSKGLPLKKRFD